jgi:hypothetical protein
MEYARAEWLNKEEIERVHHHFYLYVALTYIDLSF